MASGIIVTARYLRLGGVSAQDVGGLLSSDPGSDPALPFDPASAGVGVVDVVGLAPSLALLLPRLLDLAALASALVGLCTLT